MGKAAASAVARGLGAGVVSVGAAVGAGWVILASAPPDPPCDSDLACLPDLGPVIHAAAAFPIVAALVGPLAGLLLRVPRPWWLAAPAAWAVVLLCIGSPFLGGRAEDPIHGPFVALATLLAPYGLIAWWTSRPAPSVTRAAAPLYAILLPEQWAELDASGRLDGSPSGVQLCRRAQVTAVAGRRFAAGTAALMLVAVRAEAFGERLRWEMTPDGGPHPHLDGPLTADAVVGLYRVESAEVLDTMLPPPGTDAPAGRAAAPRSSAR